MPAPTAAIVTVGSELVEGLRVDTNTAEIARELGLRGFRVAEAVSIGDDELLLAEAIERLCARHELVITTGGLGPTHDDITREAAARALLRPLVIDTEVEAGLENVARRHREAEAAEQVFRQALILEGAEVLPATTGTAPGQVVPTAAGMLALLPGPPAEMRPMLALVVGHFEATVASPVELGVVGMSESDVQVAAQRALVVHPYVELTVLAKPGDVQVVLFDAGAGAAELARAGEAVASEIGPACYGDDGSTLAEVVVREATARGLTLGTAESCTGGLAAAALTDVAGSSAVFLGSVVSYANSAKIGLLGVSEDTLAEVGAVSERTACEMAEGARATLGADIAVSVTGIAGPDGGSADKPVGLVWFGVATPGRLVAHERRFLGGSRDAVRARATATALDLIRREFLDLS